MKKHLVVSDIHGDLEALVCAANRAGNDFGGFDDVWCLGDVLGRCEPEEAGECIEWLQSYPSVCLLGNWDWWIRYQPDCATKGMVKQEEIEKREMELRKFRDWLFDDSNEQIKNYVDAWLNYRTFTELNLTLVHGTPIVDKNDECRHPSQPYIPGNDDARRVFLAPKDTDNYHIFDSMQRTSVYFTGHHHVPKVYTYFPNTGRVGVNEVHGDLVDKGFSRVTIDEKNRIIRIGSVSKREPIKKGRPEFRVPTAMIFDEETRKVTIFEVK
ncbi:MAG TPA: metallophosphoesterase family protein [Anaerolineales bacterium]|nr:metallophosphoesterase family protein [Anaerolineales bacterium]